MATLRTTYCRTAMIAVLMYSAAVWCLETAAAAEQESESSVKVLVLQNKPFGITPEVLAVKKGTTVIWFNKDPEPVTVAFLAPLGPACKVPVNFYSSVEGNFATGLIPQSGIASMCIVMPGSYDYEVQRLVTLGTQKPKVELIKGKIIVQ